MAKFYDHLGAAVDDNATNDAGYPAIGYQVFMEAFEALSSDAERLAYADRVAEKARLLRKIIVEKGTLVNNVSGWTGRITSGSNTAVPTIIDDYDKITMNTAAVNVFKAANNDV